MFRIPDPNAGGPPSPGMPGGAPRPLPFTKVGPLAMLLFLGVVVLAVFVLGTIGRDADAPKEPVAGPDQITREQKIEVLDDGDLAEQYPTTIRGELQDDIFRWFQQPGREEISDRAAVDEAEWARWFLSDDVRPRLERLPGWVFGELGDTDKVLHEPGPYRGRLVQVWGAVSSIEETRLPTDPPTRAWRLGVDDPSGTPWTVLTVREPPAGTRPGSWIKAFGAFVKLRPAEEGRQSFVVFSAQKPLVSYPPVEEKAISADWAADVHDDTMESSRTNPGEEEPFWRLLNYVRTMGPEGCRAKVAKGELKVTDMTGTLGATELAQRPALHRFELVRLRVGLAHGEGAFVEEQDLPENAGNIRSVVRGFVADYQGRTMWVISAFPKDTFRLGNARLAVLEGFFYKRKAVDTQDGKLYWMPVVVATSMTPIDTSPGQSNVAKYATWLAIVGACACSALWVFLVVRGRRAAQESLRRHAERMDRRARDQASSSS